MDLWGEDMTTSKNYINYTPDLSIGLIARKLQAQNYSNLPAISTTSIAAAPGVQKMLPDTTPSFKKLLDSSRLVVVEEGVTANSMQAMNKYPRLIDRHQPDRVNNTKAADR